MGLNLLSFPRYVFQQDSQPSVAVKGALWVDTNATPIETFVYNGVSWISLSSDVGWVADAMLQMGLNVLINSVAASSTLNDWDEIFVDEFTDADGTSNTIDTGNTTAVFDTDNYANFTAENSTETVTGRTSTNDWSATFTAINAGFISDVNLAVEDTVQWRVRVIQDSVTLAEKTGTKSGTGDVSVTFGASDYLNMISPTTDSGTFTIAFFKTGGGNNIQRTTDTFSHAGTNFSYSTQMLSGGTAGYSSATNVEYSTGANAIVQTNALTATTGATDSQLYCHNTLTASGTITYDISMDNGNTYTTDCAINSKNTITSTTGTQMIIKLNLNGTGANIAQANDYGVLLYY